jgi:putative tryptophan/tyrosine transport system substrate-binding protein
MRRRDFIAAVCSGAVARPLAVRAQQKAMPVIGVLIVERYKHSFEQEMHNLGYDEGKTVHLEYRALRPADAIPRFAAELVDLKVDRHCRGRIGSRASSPTSYANHSDRGNR